ncbi:DUF6434 domain-containing protein [Enterococcus sp. HY326]|uniref:DUF6434 domain-containing protein n=1 Tax=Enterococcus sp. HY326 TaxID=2971265 RepID=UPI00223FFD5A|nr:DUF6434 domain-containing protein [Enterococcus sp. HY326]
MKRPAISKNMNPDIFQDFYYLKEELVSFCKSENIPTSGNKEVLTERIVEYLKSGQIKARPKNKKSAAIPSELTVNSIIEKNIVCSETHRSFFLKEIGSHFKFKVAFQQWLKANHGKTYAEAISVYPTISTKKPTKIDAQFEYNTYIRDFFLENKNRNLSDAIKCWNYKKGLPGHNKYEANDLKAI